MTLPKTGFRQVVSLFVMAGFAWAYLADPTDASLRSTLSNAFVAVIAYWIGSSQGAHENREALNKLHEKDTP